MKAKMRAPIAPIGWSIALHAVLVGLLIVGLSLPEREPQQVVLPIDAVVVDDTVLEAAGQKRRKDERVADEKRKREEAEVEAERLEQERLEKQQEQKRQEEQQRLESEQVAEQQARAEAEVKQKTEAEAIQKSEQQAKAAAEKKRAAQDAKLRQEREADLRAQLAEEETRTSAGFQSLKSSYVRAIQAHVEQRWYEPPGTTQGLVCRIFVMQIPGGEVVGMRFGSCNGGAALRQSVETAVRNSSPLPAPPDPALFEREVELVFTPKEPRR